MDRVNQAMLDACRTYTLPDEIVRCNDPRVVFSEPYIPFVPQPWNRVLVLAEAQNLSKEHKKYRAKLEQMGPAGRLTRLLRSDGKLGIRPWDNGLLKIAVEVGLGRPAEEAAVSNGVLWSLVDAKDRNVNPNREMIEHSARLWAALLAILQPACIVAAGTVARKVLKALPKGAWQGPVLPVRLPAPRVLAGLSGLFHAPDLLAHYPEVAAVKKARAEWFAPDDAKSSRLIYACHVASHARRTEIRAHLARLLGTRGSAERT